MTDIDDAASGARRLDAHIWDREPNDFYIEPEWCSARLFAEEPFKGSVYDPACGSGRVIDGAVRNGLHASGSDIAGEVEPEDFLTHRGMHDNIVTNVPFKILRRFTLHALELARYKVATIIAVPRLNAALWLEDTPLARIWLLTPRPSMPPGRVVLAGGKAGGGKVDFCWLVFERGHAGRPELRWLHREAAR